MVAQKFDSDLLEAIRVFLGTEARVNRRTGHEDFFYLETYNRASLTRIIEHCRTFPLLGEKAIQLKAFIEHPCVTGASQK